jgi:hypothetical protein
MKGGGGWIVWLIKLSENCGNKDIPEITSNKAWKLNKLTIKSVYRETYESDCMTFPNDSDKYVSVYKIDG